MAKQMTRETSVFINCPFDGDFAELLDAIIFATVCCGFVPRLSFDTGTVAEPRMARIASAIWSSKYSIHDLSRCTGEGPENLARFNMPLELGMAIARRFSATTEDTRHDWLVLVPEGHMYQQFISDLSGYDAVTYDKSVPSVIQAVMSWLAFKPEFVDTDPKAVLEALPGFLKEKAQLSERWGRSIPLPRILAAARTAAGTYLDAG